MASASEAAAAEPRPALCKPAEGRREVEAGEDASSSAWTLPEGSR